VINENTGFDVRNLELHPIVLSKIRLETNHPAIGLSVGKATRVVTFGGTDVYDQPIVCFAYRFNCFSEWILIKTYYLLRKPLFIEGLDVLHPGERPG
jgi:hypothetical protein